MTATKNAAKKVRGKVFKQVKIRDLDDLAAAKLQEGDVALKEGLYDQAITIFQEALPLVQACPRKKKPQKPKPNKLVKAKKAAVKEEFVFPEIDVSKILKPPESNTVAKVHPLQTCTYAENSPENLRAHLKATSGKWQTRFPPEPNGYLHLGHAKAINFNFLVATANGGECLLRFDDTNPAAEKKEYIDMIVENLNWLGHKPCKITYSSDYFQQLYEMAEQLIRQGDAYVCAQSQADVKVCAKLYS